MTLSVDEFFDSTVGAAAVQATLTSKSNYYTAYRFINITSYSQRTYLQECPRKFQQIKIARVTETEPLTNIDFAFGHAVGAGVQTYAKTNNKDAALFAAFLAWNIDPDTENSKKGKSLPLAILAVLKFIPIWNSMSDEWELASFNGKQAAELLFFLDCENGYYHVGHVDLVLRNKHSGHYAVWELKTTSIQIPDEAMYGNSDQGLGYSIVIDAVAGLEGGVSTFTVFYNVYSSTKRSWTMLPFVKSRNERANWLQDLLYDHAAISTYRKIGLFPKRGNACWSFSKRCPHYGVCDFKVNTSMKFEEWTPDMPFPETPDFKFKLSDLARDIFSAKSS